MFYNRPYIWMYSEYILSKYVLLYIYQTLSIWWGIKFRLPGYTVSVYERGIYLAYNNYICPRTYGYTWSIYEQGLCKHTSKYDHSLLKF